MITLNEFKHWLEGFQEAIGDTPTKEQWERIKSKLDETYQSNHVNIPIYAPFTAPVQTPWHDQFPFQLPIIC